MANRHIGVALSGAGHRGSLFGLGALLYLIDAGKGPEISCISSVSGGSITNAWVGLRTDVFVAGSGDFRTDVAPLAHAVSTGGTLWRAPLTYAYLALVAVVLGVATYLCFPLSGAWPLVVWLVAVGVVGWLVRHRGRVAAHALDRALFEGAGLRQLNPATDHVLGAADLQTREPVYLAGRWVYAWRLGWGEPGDLSLAQAVQASASRPGAYAPYALPLERHRFPMAGAGDGSLTRLLLADGGVYDGTGTDWLLQLRARVREGGAPDPPPNPVDEVVAVEASATGGRRGRRSAGWPLVGELSSLREASEVLATQAGAAGSRWLHARLLATRDGVAVEDVRLQGAVVSIGDTPYQLARQLASGSDDVARRARSVLDLLGAGDERAWRAEVAANSYVGAGLGRIPADRAAHLMRHAYVLAMVNLHVLRDYPLRPLPAVDDFERLVGQG